MVGTTVPRARDGRGSAQIGGSRSSGMGWPASRIGPADGGHGRSAVRPLVGDDHVVGRPQRSEEAREMGEDAQRASARSCAASPRGRPSRWPAPGSRRSRPSRPAAGASAAIMSSGVPTIDVSCSISSSSVVLVPQPGDAPEVVVALELAALAHVGDRLLARLGEVGPDHEAPLLAAQLAGRGGRRLLAQRPLRGEVLLAADEPGAERQHADAVRAGADHARRRRRAGDGDRQRRR